jgi:hypothetical protein
MKRSQRVTDWTWKHYDFDRLCPKVSLNNELYSLCPQMIVRVPNLGEIKAH